MDYTKEDKIKSIQLGINQEEVKVKRLQDELCDWTLSETQFINKRKVLNSTKTFVKKLKKDIEKLLIKAKQ